jgi:hypothetical protein
MCVKPDAMNAVATGRLGKTPLFSLPKLAGPARPGLDVSDAVLALIADEV